MPAGGEEFGVCGQGVRGLQPYFLPISWHWIGTSLGWGGGGAGWHWCIFTAKAQNLTTLLISCCLVLTIKSSVDKKICSLHLLQFQMKTSAWQWEIVLMGSRVFSLEANYTGVTAINAKQIVLSAPLNKKKPVTIPQTSSAHMLLQKSDCLWDSQTSNSKLIPESSLTPLRSWPYGLLF